MKKIFVICLAITMLFSTGCGTGSSSRSERNPLQSIDTAMGTVISQSIYVEADEMAAESDVMEEAEYASGADDKITDDILQNITNLEQKTLSWRLPSSEVYTVNASAGLESGISLSEDLREILAECLGVSLASDGAFDITIGKVVRLWDIDNWATAEASSDYAMPGAEELQNSLQYTGYKKLKLQENTLFLPAEMQLDLGAVGKGIALDSLREYLAENEAVRGAVISVGGSVLTYGEKPDSEPWRVAVVNPTDTGKNLGYLELRGQWCVSTSGDYERYVEVNGTRFHHIIDPATGYPADGDLSSVTVLTDDGLLSDALSTACFILGQEKGMELAESYGAEALLVDCEGNIAMTEGMGQYFHAY